MTRIDLFESRVYPAWRRDGVGKDLKYRRTSAPLPPCTCLLQAGLRQNGLFSLPERDRFPLILSEFPAGSVEKTPAHSGWRAGTSTIFISFLFLIDAFAESQGHKRLSKDGVVLSFFQAVRKITCFSPHNATQFPHRHCGSAWDNSIHCRQRSNIIRQRYC